MKPNMGFEHLIPSDPIPSDPILVCFSQEFVHATDDEKDKKLYDLLCGEQRVVISDQWAASIVGS